MWFLRIFKHVITNAISFYIEFHVCLENFIKIPEIQNNKKADEKLDFLYTNFPCNVAKNISKKSVLNVFPVLRFCVVFKKVFTEILWFFKRNLTSLLCNFEN